MSLLETLGEGALTRFKFDRKNVLLDLVWMLFQGAKVFQLVIADVLSGRGSIDWIDLGDFFRMIAGKELLLELGLGLSLLFLLLLDCLKISFFTLEGITNYECVVFQLKIH